jgi:FKBP-type peptidyl-prolyl cis-trans isomerase SlyD
MKIEKNVLVHIDYTLKNPEGILLNPEEEELIYLHGGYGHVFKDFESALEGKSVGEAFCVTLSPEQAFGLYDESLLIKESISELPEDLYIGMELDGPSDNEDESLIYTVTHLEDDYALLNGNHPLAGVTLVFEGTITELEALNEEQVQELLEHDAHEHEHDEHCGEGCHH